MQNLAFNKVVNLYYTNRQDENNPLTVIALAYEKDVSEDGWEMWNAKDALYVDGITKFLNLTYEDSDNGQTYVQTLNLKVKASGAPEPSLPSTPAPYATPSGFGNDITEYLAVSSSSNIGIAHDRMFLNVNPAIDGAANGTVVAARSGPYYSQKLPDYAYNWVRDASLTMDVVQTLYSAATDEGAKSAYEDILFEYATARATEQVDPNLQTGLGEPKFYLNNTIFSGPWGRPQSDGPATAAITLMEFANGYLANGGSKSKVGDLIYSTNGQTPVPRDLLYVASNWSEPTYDLWEETLGTQFYTQMVQRRALVQGAKFASQMDDSSTAATLSAQVDAISASIENFWDPNREILLYGYPEEPNEKTSFLDTAVLLGIVHGYAGDNFYSYTNDQVLSTAVRVSTSFIDVYPIANETRSYHGETLSPPVGRYPEDRFNGVKTGTKPIGNPWYLCTATFAQFMYSASSEYSSANSISVTNYSKPFFDYFAPEAGVEVGTSYQSGSQEFNHIIESLNGWGDAFLRTVQYYTPSNGHLTEEINKDTGKPQGAADLTWSYASFLTAAMARADLRGDNGYAKDLANLGVAKNS